MSRLFVKRTELGKSVLAKGAAVNVQSRCNVRQHNIFQMGAGETRELKCYEFKSRERGDSSYFSPENWHAGDSLSRRQEAEGKLHPEKSD